MEKQLITPDIKLVLIDDTEYWRNKPEFIDKIYSVFVYDANLNVHACSIQGSYELYFIDYCWTYHDEDSVTDEQSEVAFEYTREGCALAEPVEYYSRLDTTLQKSIDITDTAKWKDFDPKSTDQVRNNMQHIVDDLRNDYDAISYILLNK